MHRFLLSSFIQSTRSPDPTSFVELKSVVLTSFECVNDDVFLLLLHCPRKLRSFQIARRDTKIQKESTAFAPMVNLEEMIGPEGHIEGAKGKLLLCQYRALCHGTLGLVCWTFQLLGL